MKNSQENLESLIEAINELLNEVRKEQIMENKNAEKRHKACMQNLSKLREYNKIAEIIIPKQTHGPIGTVRLAWMPQYTRFGNELRQQDQEI